MMFDLPWAHLHRSDTLRRLRRWRRLTLTATVLVGLAVGGVGYGAHATVRTVAERTAPATTAVQVARAALAEANRAVVASFRSGTARLAGPGQRYQDGITRANHSLAQLGEHYTRDLATTQQLQLINAMLVTYMGLVAQADTAHRLAGATGADYDLSPIYLWHASKLLFDREGGILALIDAVDRPVAADLAGQAGSWLLQPAALAVLAPALAVLLGLLLASQVFLLRRFQRLVNPPLALASVLLVMLATWAVLTTLDTGRSYQVAMSAQAELTTGWQEQAAVASRETYTGLQELLSRPCADQPGQPPAAGADTAAACEQAVDAALARSVPPGAARPDLTVPGPDAAALEASDQIRFNTAIAASTAPTWLRFGIPALVAVTAGLVLLGFKPRLAEFRA